MSFIPLEVTASGLANVLSLGQRLIVVVITRARFYALRRPGAANGACPPCSVREQTMVGVRGRMLSWVNFGGVEPVVLARHGSFGRGVAFAPIADRLQGAARVVALDQRGHGLADHGGSLLAPSRG